MSERRRAWPRWVEISIEHSIRSICQIARTQGMEIIHAYRPDMCFWNALALRGTRAQMTATEEAWTAAGLRWKHRASPGAWPAALTRSRELWHETTVDWSQEERDHADR